MGMSTLILKPLPAGDVQAGAPRAPPPPPAAGDVEAGARGARHRAADDRPPCRRCLRDAEPGEPLVLASYDPFTVRSPYAGEGPVFVHADGCEPFHSAPGEVSEQV